MGEWNEAEHPRDDEGKFTYKGGGTTLYGHVEKSSLKNNSTTNNMLLKNNKIQNSIKIINKKEMDTYTQNLVKEIENTDINVKGIGNVKVKTLVPDIENYIKDNRTKDEKRADILYPSMKKENPIMSDIKVLATIFPFFVEVLNEELEEKGKEKFTNIQVMQSFEWETTRKNFLELLKQREKWEFNKPMSKYIKPTIDKMQKPENKEAIKEMIFNFVNGGPILLPLSKCFEITDAANLLKLNKKDANLNVAYTKRAKKYNSYKELSEPFRSIVKTKLNDQNIPKNAKGLFFKPNSQLSRKIARTPELLQLLNKRTDDQVFCSYNNTKIPSVSYEYDEQDPQKTINMYLSFHNADIYNLRSDIFGNISGYLIDTTDYNPGKNEPLIVQEAKELQDMGILEPKFIIVHFIIPAPIAMKEIFNENDNF